MALKFGDTATVVAADAIVDLIDGGAGDGVLQIWSGAQASDPDAAPGGSELVEIPFGDPAFGGASVSGSDAEATANALDTGVTATGTGTAGHFRVLDSDSNVIFTGTVTGSGGGGDIELDNTSITTGQVVEISSLVFSFLRDQP